MTIRHLLFLLPALPVNDPRRTIVSPRNESEGFGSASLNHPVQHGTFLASARDSPGHFLSTIDVDPPCG